jgi:hypothetical protein
MSDKIPNIVLFNNYVLTLSSDIQISNFLVLLISSETLAYGLQVRSVSIVEINNVTVMLNVS